MKPHDPPTVRSARQAWLLMTTFWLSKGFQGDRRPQTSCEMMLCDLASTVKILWYLNCYMHQNWDPYKAIQCAYCYCSSSLSLQFWVSCNSICSLKGHSSNLILYFHKIGRLAIGILWKENGQNQNHYQSHNVLNFSPTIPIMQFSNIFSFPQHLSNSMFPVYNARLLETTVVSKSRQRYPWLWQHQGYFHRDIIEFSSCHALALGSWWKLC